MRKTDHLTLPLLSELIRVSAYSEGDLSTRIGRHRGFLSARLRSGSLRLDDFLHTLGALGLIPSAFFYLRHVAASVDNTKLAVSLVAKEGVFFLDPEASEDETVGFERFVARLKSKVLELETSEECS